MRTAVLMVGACLAAAPLMAQTPRRLPASLAGYTVGRPRAATIPGSVPCSLDTLAHQLRCEPSDTVTLHFERDTLSLVWVHSWDPIPRPSGFVERRVSQYWRDWYQSRAVSLFGEPDSVRVEHPGENAVLTASWRNESRMAVFHLASSPTPGQWYLRVEVFLGCASLAQLARCAQP